MGILNGQALEFEMQEQLEIYSETVNKFIKIGKYSSTLLLSLVEDVLNLSKIESNIFTINMAKLNAKELFEMFEFQSERKTSN
jgi:signal transduction histidine kinase